MLRNRVLGIIGLAGLFVVLCGCGTKPASTPISSTPSPVEPGPKAQDPPGKGRGPESYELDPAKHVFPDKPASGQLYGKPFTPDRVELEGNRLVLRQGKDFFADLSIEIILDSKRKATEETKLVVRPSQKWTDDIPSLHVSAMSGKGLPDTKFVTEGYALTLELGKADKGKSQGKIYLCLPDAQQSCLVGTFVAQRKRSLSEAPGADDAPFIQGSVSPPLTKGQSVSVGYVGLPAGGGNPISDGAGGQAFGEGGGGGVRSTTFAPREATVRFEKLTPRFDFTNLPAGRYLVYARVKDGPVAWEWIDVATDGQVTADIKLDATKLGTVEVKLPPGETEARLVPSELGTPPPGDRFLDQLAYSLDLDAEAKDGVATIKNVPAGKYQVRAGRIRGTVEVVAGKTTTVELKTEKN